MATSCCALYLSPLCRSFPAALYPMPLCPSRPGLSIRSQRRHRVLPSPVPRGHRYGLSPFLMYGTRRPGPGGVTVCNSRALMPPGTADFHAVVLDLLGLYVLGEFNCR